MAKCSIKALWQARRCDETPSSFGKKKLAYENVASHLWGEARILASQGVRWGWNFSARILEDLRMARRKDHSIGVLRQPSCWIRLPRSDFLWVWYLNGDGSLFGGPISKKHRYPFVLLACYGLTGSTVYKRAHLCRSSDVIPLPWPLLFCGEAKSFPFRTAGVHLSKATSLGRSRQACSRCQIP